MGVDLVLQDERELCHLMSYRQNATQMFGKVAW